MKSNHENNNKYCFSDAFAFRVRALASLAFTSAPLSAESPEQFTWTATGSLNQAREQHTATLLADDRVLVAGGFGNVVPLRTAELYDPMTGVWSQTGNLVEGRTGHTATLLPNGKVLVAGGTNVTAQSEAELYDPTTGDWITTGSMNPRTSHSATLLSDDRVLVSGGHAPGGNDLLASSEIYDPSTEAWTETGDLNQARELHESVLLANGDVLLICGIGKNDSGFFYRLQSAEIYDVATGAWSFTGDLSTVRQNTTLTLLLNGRALATGGLADDPNGLKTAEIYDPSTGLWSLTRSMKAAREGHTATALANGAVVAAGGASATRVLRSTEIFDPRRQTWTTVGQLVIGRFFHTATLLQNEAVLIAGGRSTRGQETRTAELGVP